MKPPRTFLAAPETQRLGYATRNGELLGVGKGMIGDACSALRKAALMRVSAPVYVFASCRSKCEERRRVELDRGKKQLDSKADYEKLAEQAAPPGCGMTKTRCPLGNSPWDSAKEGRR